MVDEIPIDPLGDAVAEILDDVLLGATIELSYAPRNRGAVDDGPATAAVTVDGPPGWRVSVIVHPKQRVGHGHFAQDPESVAELLRVAPAAAMRAIAPFRRYTEGDDGIPVTAVFRRSVRDAVAAEILAEYLASRVAGSIRSDLVGETIEYLIELSGTRVESHELTHGVVITDVLQDEPRLALEYPTALQAAKRAPLLFDGQRAVLVVDPAGRARTELQRNRIERLVRREGSAVTTVDDGVESGALVAAATRAVGGLGFFLRDDRSIWTFVDGRPLLVRRGARWTAFPLELSVSIENMIGGGSVATLIAQAAFLISARPRGAILAVVDDPAVLEGIVSAKDRYDLRTEVDPLAMQIETRLHHLIHAEDLDEQTLVRLAMLDGATILDREGRLVAYGAIVTSADSQHEGARTAAARTLSMTAAIVLNVSVDGDITIFREGVEVATLLGRRADYDPQIPR